jgi:hypothetical protein
MKYNPILRQFNQRLEARGKAAKGVRLIFVGFCNGRQKGAAKGVRLIFVGFCKVRAISHSQSLGELTCQQKN